MPPLTALRARPILTFALCAGLATFAALSFVPNPWPAEMRPILAWSVFAALYVAITWWTHYDDTPEQLARRAENADEGRHLVLALCVIAAALSVSALALEFKAAKQGAGLGPTLHVGFAIGTVALSWLFMHTVFAAHYAHEFYAPADGGGRRGGLKFPGRDAHPDWNDFLHFALVIGVAAQTADVQIESRVIRHTVTWHGVVAFVFNTVIVAMSVNLGASLF